MTEPTAPAPEVTASDWENDCMQFLGRALNGEDAHWCHDFDGLPIDKTCAEYEYCTCAPLPDKDEIMRMADTYADGPHTQGYYGAHRAALEAGANEMAAALAEAKAKLQIQYTELIAGDDRRDAERYRHLKCLIASSDGQWLDVFAASVSDLDSRIDAAIERKGKG